MPKSVTTLKKPAEFQRVFQKGKEIHEKNVSVYYISDEELKIGLMVSRKEGKAVQRNRTRRLLKEFFRLNQDKTNSAHIIVIARAPLLNSYYETSSIMLKLLWKAGLIK